MHMRTFGLLYHRKACDSSVYYVYLNISYATKVVAECVVTHQSRRLELEVKVAGSLVTGNGFPPC